MNKGRNEPFGSHSRNTCCKWCSSKLGEGFLEGETPFILIYIMVTWTYKLILRYSFVQSASPKASKGKGTGHLDSTVLQFARLVSTLSIHESAQFVRHCLCCNLDFCCCRPFYGLQVLGRVQAAVSFFFNNTRSFFFADCRCKGSNYRFGRATKCYNDVGGGSFWNVGCWWDHVQ
jgi:hypothetical protein